MSLTTLTGQKFGRWVVLSDIGERKVACRCDCGNERYVGRGIKICERWDAFENFVADMGQPPSRGYSIDRIDNDGDYEPSNCRWATAREQQCNKTNTRWITANGKRMAMANWAIETGIKIGTIWQRLKNGMSEQEAVTLPVRGA